jgi:hypothetical protein
MVSPWFQIIRTHLHSFSSEFSRCKDEFSDKLLAARADVNTHDDFGRTPPMYMAEKGEVRPIELEVANGADVNAGQEWMDAVNVRGE